jgi:hypothetical protein
MQDETGVFYVYWVCGMAGSHYWRVENRGEGVTEAEESSSSIRAAFAGYWRYSAAFGAKRCGRTGVAAATADVGTLVHFALRDLCPDVPNTTGI